MVERERLGTGKCNVLRSEVVTKTVNVMRGLSRRRRFERGTTMQEVRYSPTRKIVV